MGHSSGTLLWDTLVGHSCRTLLWDTLVGHSCRTLLSLTSDVPLLHRLHQRVSHSPVARRRANALPTKAAQIRVALRHHGRNFTTRSAHTLEANISHDTTNHPAHQRHAAFTACVALPSGTAPSARTFHQGRANPQGTRLRVTLRVCKTSKKSNNPKCGQNAAYRENVGAPSRQQNWLAHV